MGIQRFAPFALLLAGSVSALPAAPTISLNAVPHPAVYGTPVTLIATVSPPGATGKVTFYNGVTVLGIAALSSGSATLTTSLLPAGALSLQARYSGDSSNAASLSTVFAETVNELSGNGFISSGSGWATVGPVDPGNPGSMVYFGASPPVIADFNSDGQPDLAVVNYGLFSAGTYSVSVLLGDGNGGFDVRAAIPIVGTPCTGNTPPHILGGDFNNDGKADLVFNFSTCGPPFQTYIALWLGDGTGGFTPINIPVAATNALAAADFNGDGNLDLAVASPSGDSGSLITVWLGNGQGGFPTKLGPFKAPTAGQALALDFNGDGYPDMALIDGDGNVSLLLGDGSGTLAPVGANLVHLGCCIQSMVAGDFNQDGFQDIVAANAGGQLGVILGNAAGSVSATEIRVSLPLVGDLKFIAPGDFNGDGKLDLALLIGTPVGGLQYTIQTMSGDGNGGFAQPVQGGRIWQSAENSAPFPATHPQECSCSWERTWSRRPLSRFSRALHSPNRSSPTLTHCKPS